MVESVIKTGMEFLKEGAYVPFFVLVIAGLCVSFYKYITKSATNRENYLIESITKKEQEFKEAISKKDNELKEILEKKDRELMETLDKKDQESREDKKSLMNFITDINKALNDITSCIKSVQNQVEASMDRMGLRLDYIEKKIDISNQTKGGS